MKATTHKGLFYLFAAIFLAALLYLNYKGQTAINAVPFALVAVYAAIYHIDKLFLFVVLFTPLSVNIEEFVANQSIGLFLPTEPLLFGILILVILNQLRKNQFEKEFIRHPITVIIILQLIWIFLTAVTSELPLVSFKFLLMKLWFVIPIYFFGYYFFKNEKNIHYFIWLFIGSLTVVVLYTLTNHAMNGFDEESGHWVMYPFFKDHTSYGAILALVYPVFFGVLLGRKNSVLLNSTLIFLIVLFGFAIIMSYTRAAWLSLFGAAIIYFLIRFKVKFKYLLILAGVAGFYVIMSWTSIQHNLERNRSEHATENMDERLESMANITTDASNLERLNRWGSAVRMWQERPVVGWGPGTYAMVYAPFQLASGKTIISTNSGNRGNAHSEYLGPLSEQGLPGMLLMIAFVGFIIYTGIKLYLRMPASSLRNLILTMILGLITYFAHGILNNYLDTDKAAIPVYGITAIIVMLDIRFPKTSEIMEEDDSKGILDENS